MSKKRANVLIVLIIAVLALGCGNIFSAITTDVLFNNQLDNSSIINNTNGSNVSLNDESHYYSDNSYVQDSSQDSATYGDSSPSYESSSNSNPQNYESSSVESSEEPVSDSSPSQEADSSDAVPVITSGNGTN